jgi:hypothetical protein
MLTIVEIAPTGEASQKTPAKVEFMAKAAVAGVDVAAVEEHLARYVVSCPLCKGVGQLGVAHEECKIISGADAKDGIWAAARRRPPGNRSGRLLHAARIALEPFLGPSTRVDELRRAEAFPGLRGPEFAPELVDGLREAGELGRRLGI